MKQTDKNKSSLVAAALVIGTVFILSVVYQHWTVEDIIQEPVAHNEEMPTNKNQSFEELVDDFDIEVDVVYSSENENEPVKLSFSDAFTTILLPSILSTIQSLLATIVAPESRATPCSIPVPTKGDSGFNKGTA